MHANLAILRATAAMQKGSEINEIALSIYYAPSSAHPVCFFKHCILTLDTNFRHTILIHSVLSYKEWSYKEQLVEMPESKEQ